MIEQRYQTWVVAASFLAGIVVTALVVGAVLIGAGGPDDGDPASTGATPDAPALPAGDRLAEMEAGGELATMVEQHQAMLDQMRVSVNPQMLDLMNKDPMWRMLRSGEFTRLLEEHEQNIDRMLAREG